MHAGRLQAEEARTCACQHSAPADLITHLQVQGQQANVSINSDRCFTALSSLMQQQQPDAVLSEVRSWGWAHQLPTELSSVQKFCNGALQLPIELLERWVSDAVIYICRLTCAKVKHDSQ